MAKALVLIAVLAVLSECCKLVARKVLNIKEPTMNEEIYDMFASICNAFVAFAISIAAGVMFSL